MGKEADKSDCGRGSNKWKGSHKRAPGTTEHDLRAASHPFVFGRHLLELCSAPPRKPHTVGMSWPRRIRTLMWWEVRVSRARSKRSRVQVWGNSIDSFFVRGSWSSTLLLSLPYLMRDYRCVLFLDPLAFSAHRAVTELGWSENQARKEECWARSNLSCSTAPVSTSGEANTLPFSFHLPLLPSAWTPSTSWENWVNWDGKLQPM